MKIFPLISLDSTPCPSVISIYSNKIENKDGVAIPSPNPIIDHQNPSREIREGFLRVPVRFSKIFNYFHSANNLMKILSLISLDISPH